DYDPTTRYVQYFYREWLELIKPKAFVDSAIFNTLSAPIPFSNGNADVPMQILDEEEELIYRTTWQSGGRYQDLLLNNIGNLGQHTGMFYQGYGDITFGAPLQLFPLPAERGGILTRPAFLATGEETTNPVVKGVFVRRRILCDDLQSPDFNNLP